MREIDFQHGLGENMARVVDFLGRAGVAQRVRLDQAFDVRVLAAAARDPQRAGDARIARGELLLMRAQHGQFQLIVFQQRFHAGSSRTGRSGRTARAARPKLHYSTVLEK